MYCAVNVLRWHKHTHVSFLSVGCKSTNPPNHGRTPPPQKKDPRMNGSPLWCDSGALRGNHDVTANSHAHPQSHPAQRSSAPRFSLASFVDFVRRDVLLLTKSRFSTGFVDMDPASRYQTVSVSGPETLPLFFLLFRPFSLWNIISHSERGFFRNVAFPPPDWP